MSLNIVYFGPRYEAASGGFFGSMVSENPINRVEWCDVFEALGAGQTVTITPADTAMHHMAESNLFTFLAALQHVAVRNNEPVQALQTQDSGNSVTHN